ncbi:MAG: tetratricopeptide repeat protein [Bacteroidia bacterium]
MKRFLCLFILLTLILPLFSQNREIDSLQNLVQNMPGDTGKITLLNKLSITLRKKSLFGRATAYADEALLLSQKLHDSRGIAKSYLRLGDVDFAKASFTEALEYFEKALVIFTKLDDPAGITDALNYKGNVLYDQGNYPQSLDCYLKALKISETHGSPHSLSSSYENLAYLYKDQGDLKQSLDYDKKALALREKIKDTFAIAVTYNNMGITYKRMKDYGNALRCHQKALGLRLKMNDKNGMGGSYMNIGLVYKNMEIMNKALEYELLGLKCKEEGGDKNGIATAHCNLGDAYFIIHDPGKAIDQYNLGLEVGETIQSKEIIKYCYEGLATTYEKMGDAGKALYYFKQGSAIKDSIVNESTGKQLANMQARFESDQKDHKIALLNKDKDTQAVLNAAENKKQRIIIGSVTLGLLLTLLLAIFIWRGYRQKQRDHSKISAQKEIIEEKNKDITDSINYARRIQQAMLPLEQKINRYLKDYFILFRPKAIVSGDFYWFHEKDGTLVVAVVDCTGHGVPGAFMSLIGNDLLNEIIIGRNILEPGLILQELNRGIHKALKQEETQSRDGMDMALCVIRNKELKIAAANNPVWIYRQESGEMVELGATKSAIGGHTPTDQLFETTVTTLSAGDTLYLYSDGLADQFGGPKGKKFKYKQFRDILIASASLLAPLQKEKLEQAFDQWKGHVEQVDDVTVIGIRFSI